VGLAAKGSFDKGKTLGYHAMLGTGTGTRNETDKNKRLYLSLWARPSKGWVFEVYGDFENRAEQKDVQTLQGFAGYEAGRVKVGLQYAHQTRQQGFDVEDLSLDLASAWVSGKISDKTLVHVRVDRSEDADPTGPTIAYLPFDATAKSTLFIAGLDFLPIPSVHIAPNVEVIAYDGVTPAPATEVVGRLTLYWTF
jgi:hypothetical protein